MIWHSSETNDILRELSVDQSKGLANGIADMRLEQYGKNAITSIEKPTFAKRFLFQLKNKYALILSVIAFLSFIISFVYKEERFYSPLLIIAIILINALISAYHLYKSDNALNSLHSITNPTATVLRDGVVKQIPSDELVPGDIIILKEGDYITADARLLETNNFRCNESVISGENIPVSKKANTVVDDITPADQRVNMIFSGSYVIHGTAKAVVVETGLNTEIGHTSALIQQTGADSLPLQQILDNTGKYINIVILAVCFITFFIGLIQNLHTSLPFASVTVKTLLNSMALAVAAIPESLPTISTIVIALGIQRIINDNIIIKNTKALEVLGKTSVICSDKTGILTKNHMTLRCVFDGNYSFDPSTDEPNEKDAMALRLAAACSTLENDPTENAIKEACVIHNSMTPEDVENIFPRLDVIPFDAERKTMTCIHMISGRPVAIIKGAPEIVLKKCVGCDCEMLLKKNEEMASEAMRVICVAIRPLNEIPANPSAEQIEHDLTFVGLFGLEDPIRSEAITAIRTCDEAGIRTVMITGDNPVTAAAVARRIGILKDGTHVVTGTDLAKLSDEELAENITKYTVFARVTPNDKVRIIKAFQSNGMSVTVTGDSVNDSEALAVADIGCAIGKRGVDVAKENADIIIKNSNFVSIVNAIRESRGLFANIKKSVSYLLSCNIAELLCYFAGMLIFGTSPLTAIPLLWINLLTDCAPAISLSVEKPEKDVMKNKPLTLGGHIFNGKTILSISLQSVFMAVMAVLAFGIGSKTSVILGITMAFTTLGLSQLLHAFNIKTERTIFKTDFKSSKFMWISSLITLFALSFIVLTPAALPFGMTMLCGTQFVTCGALALAVIPFCEILKIVLKTTDTAK